MPSREYTSLRQKHTNFTWSKPVGYDFKEVDNEIENYKKTIADIGELLNKKDSIIQMLKNENNRLIDELASSRIQLESVMAPVMSSRESLEILNDFSEGEFEISEDDINEQLEAEDPETPAEKQKPEPAKKSKFNIIE